MVSKHNSNTNGKIKIQTNHMQIDGDGNGEGGWENNLIEYIVDIQYIWYWDANIFNQSAIDNVWMSEGTRALEQN